MKVRKKAVEVEAVRYQCAVESEDADSGFEIHFYEAVPPWLQDALEDGTISVAGMFTAQLRISNEDHGELTCNPGDWVIRGIDGELYPCTDDVFGRTYENVL